MSRGARVAADVVIVAALVAAKLAALTAVAVLWIVGMAVIVSCGGGGSGAGSLVAPPAQVGHASSAIGPAAPLPLFHAFTEQARSEHLAGQSPRRVRGSAPDELELVVMPASVTGVFFDTFETALWVRHRHRRWIDQANLECFHATGTLRGLDWIRWEQVVGIGDARIAIVDRATWPGEAWSVQSLVRPRAVVRSERVEHQRPVQGSAELLHPGNGELTTFSTNFWWNRWQEQHDAQLVVIYRGALAADLDPNVVVVADLIGPGQTAWTEVQALDPGEYSWTVYMVRRGVVVATPAPSARTFRR